MPYRASMTCDKCLLPVICHGNLLTKEKYCESCLPIAYEELQVKHEKEVAELKEEIEEMELQNGELLTCIDEIKEGRKNA